MGDGDDVQGGYSRDDWERRDIGEVAPPFVRLWEERKVPPCKAIIPGCGRTPFLFYTTLYYQRCILNTQYNKL